MSASSPFAVNRGALPDDPATPTTNANERIRQTPPSSSCWGSLHPDILQLVAARLPASGNYGPVSCATRVCKAWRGSFLARVCQGVLQPRGGHHESFGGPMRLLTPPEGWARMIPRGGLRCLDLSRLPWAEHSRHNPEELLKAADAYAVGIAQLAPLGIASLVLWLGDGCCEAPPGVVSRHYAPLLLRPLPLLKGLRSLEASLTWEGVGPLVSALRQLLAADDCRLSDLKLRLRLPTYRDIIGSLSAAEGREDSEELSCKEHSEEFQDPETVQEAMQPFRDLRQLLEEHPHLCVSLCAKVCCPGTILDDGWVVTHDLPMGEALEALGGAVTELELRNVGLPPGTPDFLRGVKRLVMVEADPDPQDPWIHTDSVLHTLAALPALEEFVMDVGGDAVSVGKFVRVPS